MGIDPRRIQRIRRSRGPSRWQPQGMNIAGVHLDLRGTLPLAKAVIADIEALGVKALFFNTNAADPDKRTKVLQGLAAAMGPDEYVHVFMHSLAFGTLKPFIPPLREDGTPGPAEAAIDHRRWI